MRTTKVKICGVRSAEIVKKILRLPVDHIGFMFAESKRRIAIDEAAELARVIKEDDERSSRGSVPQIVGVFVNPSREQLFAVMEKVPLDMIQLHLGETPEFCLWVKETFRLPVIKAFSAAEPGAAESGSQPSGRGNFRNAVLPEADALQTGDAYEGHADYLAKMEKTAAAKLEPYRGAVDMVLLDTHDPHVGGGTGRTFNWEVIPFYQEWCKEAGIPLYIAGGLHAGNVRKLIDDYGPDGVDVSSGVETAGVKDIEKIRAFVERVNRL